MGHVAVVYANVDKVAQVWFLMLSALSMFVDVKPGKRLR